METAQGVKASALLKTFPPTEKEERVVTERADDETQATVGDGKGANPRNATAETTSTRDGCKISASSRVVLCVHVPWVSECNA